MKRLTTFAFRIVLVSLVAVATLIACGSRANAQRVYGASTYHATTTNTYHASTTTVYHASSTTVYHGAALPAGYYRSIPVGYTKVYHAGYSCFYVGGIYYRPVFYQGATVYVKV